ncbi:MAG: hypothetical protein K6A30_00520, partial [Lachnospiraceae bacterium]|nr:hypothetical protein [Lachnospiraceae bacterium]
MKRKLGGKVAAMAIGMAAASMVVTTPVSVLAEEVQTQGTATTDGGTVVGNGDTVVGNGDTVVDNGDTGVGNGDTGDTNGDTGVDNGGTIITYDMVKDAFDGLLVTKTNKNEKTPTDKTVVFGKEASEHSQSEADCKAIDDFKAAVEKVIKSGNCTDDQKTELKNLENRVGMMKNVAVAFNDAIHGDDKSDGEAAHKTITKTMGDYVSKEKVQEDEVLIWMKRRELWANELAKNEIKTYAFIQLVKDNSKDAQEA